MFPFLRQISVRAWLVREIATTMENEIKLIADSLLELGEIISLEWIVRIHIFEDVTDGVLHLYDVII